MAFLTATAASVAFKRLMGKAHTDTGRGIGNETVISGFNFSGGDVYGDSISFNNPTTAISNGVCSALTTLKLVADAGSNGHAYFAQLPVGWVNPDATRFLNKTTGSPAAAGDYIKDTNLSIIGGNYGLNYTPTVYNNGTLVPPSDSSDWVFDTYAGVLTQEGSDDGSMVNYGTTGTVQCYFYVGKSVNDKITNVTLVGTKTKVETLTYSLTSYGLIGALNPVTTETTSVTMTPYGATAQEEGVDYSVIQITDAGATGFTVGYYIAVFTNTINLLVAAGATATGDNPTIGLSGVLTSGDRVQVTYNIAE